MKNYLTIPLLLTQALLSHMLHSEQVAFVTNYADNTLQPIYLSTHTTGDVINVGLQPVGIAIASSPKGSTAYVANNGDGNVIPIALDSATIGTPIPAGGALEQIAITTDGSTAYASNDNGNIYPINLATSELGNPIFLGEGSGPWGVAIGPNKTVYAVDGNHDLVYVIFSNAIKATIPVGRGPFQIAISPSGKTAYTTNVKDGTLTAIDLKNPAYPTYTIGLPYGPNPPKPLGIAITANGKKAYVTDFANNQIVSVDLGNEDIGKPIPVGKAPFGICMAPDQNTVYVANSGDGTVQPVSLKTNKPGAPIPVGKNPLFLAITNIVYPASHFTGKVTLNTATKKYTLNMQWQTSRTANVQFYCLYKKGKLLAKLPGTAKSCRVNISKVSDVNGYSLTAIDTAGLASIPVSLSISPPLL